MRDQRQVSLRIRHENWLYDCSIRNLKFLKIMFITTLHLKVNIKNCSAVVQYSKYEMPETCHYVFQGVQRLFQDFKPIKNEAGLYGYRKQSRRRQFYFSI